MRRLITFLFSILVVATLFHVFAEPNPNEKKEPILPKKTKGEGCSPATGFSELSINNVKARINTGGDMWWNLQGKSKYEIPKNSGKTGMFSASLWIGGVDVNGQLKCAALRYRTKGNDYWPGPLTIDGTAAVSANTCNEYDKIFKITRAEVDEFIQWYEDKEANNGVSSAAFSGYAIPESILKWPAHGDISLGQSYYLAPFFDKDGDGVYNPTKGDYPYYDVSNSLCGTQTKTREGNGIMADQVLKGDQTLWWVFNDKGNIHTETGGSSIGLEVRAQAFAFATNDEINNMTFYSYEIINRSTYKLTETYFSQWVDTDLGYAYDDYVGCDVQRGLGYCYNGKEIDGTGLSEHYGAQPPAIGVDFFQGPYMDADGIDNPKYDSFGNQLCNESINGVNFGDGIPDNERFGMVRFVYHNNAYGGTIEAISDPEIALDYYRMLRGIWKDGTQMVFGGNAHQSDPKADGSICAFMFPGNTDPCNWGTAGIPTKFPIAGEYWTEEQAGNKPGDRRFMQSAGPFNLEPGAVNYITVGIPWARATSGGAYASVEQLKKVDDKAQRLFDNCFKVVDGPDAPDLVIQELDNQLILYLTNRKSSNNYNEKYQEFDPSIVSTTGVPVDSLYRFEGYQIFQLKDASVSVSDIYNPDKARLVAQCDVKNEVSKLVNYMYSDEVGGNVPTLMVDGANQGIKHSFVITEDKFATGDKTLINHKQYYFLAVAYGYNNFLTYSQEPGAQDPGVSGLDGQKTPYIAGRRNIQPVTGIPHLIAPENGGSFIRSSYGAGVAITRLEGFGNGGMVVELTDEAVSSLLLGPVYSLQTLPYKIGQGPINVKVVDPKNVIEGTFTLAFTDQNYSSSSVDVSNAYWTLTHQETNKKYTSDQSITLGNEQLLLDLGLSIQITPSNPQPLYPDEQPCYFQLPAYYDNIQSMVTFTPLFSSVKTADSTNNWLTWVKDVDGADPAWNWIRSGTLQDNASPENNDYSFDYFKYLECGSTLGSTVNYFIDPNENFEKMVDGAWAPYKLCSYQANGPAWYDPLSLLSPNYNKLTNLSSVDIVLTPDKSKWTRCPVIEMSEDAQLSEGNIKKFGLRAGASVNKEGLPDGTGTGMSWFPGYAIDVETGERLNIMFGEDSWLTGENGRDMMWNPTSSYTSKTGDILFGGKHYIYIVGHNSSTGCPAYDYGTYISQKLAGNNSSKSFVYRDVMWVGMPMLNASKSLLSSEVKVQLRVPKSYQRYLNNAQESVNTPQNNNYPLYQFSTQGMGVQTMDRSRALTALDMINVVPNPYYAYSSYEATQLDNRVKIVNLPQVCEVTIYTLNGTLVRAYKVDKTGVGTLRDSYTGLSSTIEPSTSIEWDLKNSAGVPIAGGLYLIHIKADGIGERIIKWYGTLRPVDLDSF